MSDQCQDAQITKMAEKESLWMVRGNTKLFSSAITMNVFVFHPKPNYYDVEWKKRLSRTMYACVCVSASEENRGGEGKWNKEKARYARVSHRNNSCAPRRRGSSWDILLTTTLRYSRWLISKRQPCKVVLAPFGNKLCTFFPFCISATTLHVISSTAADNVQCRR